MTLPASASFKASAGQMRTQSSQPVQSQGETLHRSCEVIQAHLDPVLIVVQHATTDGRATAFFEVLGSRAQLLLRGQEWPHLESLKQKDARRLSQAAAACGQIKLHLLHWVQRSMSTLGTLMAMPRFSY